MADDQNATIYPVQFEGDPQMFRFPVRVRTDMATGAIVDIDIATEKGFVFDQELPHIPHWISCQILDTAPEMALDVVHVKRADA